jgi:SAM-dependent methyltransferase
MATGPPMPSFDDHFSALSQEYARHRPHYPPELFVHLAGLAPRHELAWDCATGNGQAALELVKHFKHVMATDASAEQLKHAVPHEHVEYHVEQAEHASLKPGSVDLTTVAVAVHWFDLEAFYRTIRRVSVENGVLAVWTYHLPEISPAVDHVVSDYYARVLAGYWPEGFHYVDERYRTLPFPFEELHVPDFEMHTVWDLDRLAGFLNSWSAAARYERDRGHAPLAVVWQDLRDAWGDPAGPRPIRWPLCLRVGRVR